MRNGRLSARWRGSLLSSFDPPRRRPGQALSRKRERGLRICTRAGSLPYQGTKPIAYGRSEKMPERSLIAIETHPPIGKITEDEYFRLYQESLADPNGFWGREGKRIDWIKPYTRVMNASYDGDISIKWFEDGTLNA